MLEYTILSGDSLFYSSLSADMLNFNPPAPINKFKEAKYFATVEQLKNLHIYYHDRFTKF